MESGRMIKNWRVRQSATCFCILAAASGLNAETTAQPSPFVDRFETPPDRSVWTASNYAHPGGWIHTRWSEDQIDWRKPGQLTIRLTPNSVDETKKRFVSGELKRRKRTHYGRYEVVMRAARGPGLNSAFFTYTGPHRGDPHDEIDFEFLGREPTKVWLNYYVDGEAQKDGPVDLGFDASAAAHHYAFTWTEDNIRWYADGRLIGEIEANDAPPPKTPAEIYLSLWVGSPQWLGSAKPETMAEATYYCVAYSPEINDGPLCVVPGEE